MKPKKSLGCYNNEASTLVYSHRLVGDCGSFSKVESVYRDQHLRRLVAVMHKDTDFAETLL